MSNDDQNLQVTRATYEQIAGKYAQTNQDRSNLVTHIARFVSLVKPGGWVVDVGCGPGFDTAVFQQHNFKTIGLDYTHAMIQAGRAELGIQANFVQADMRHLPFANQIDGLWVSASLLHLTREDAPIALKRFHDVLQTGGILCLATKQGDGDEWTSHSYGAEVPRYFTYWQPDSLDTLLQNAGFTIVDGWITEEKSTWIVRFAQKTPPSL
jgi:ubiquinone/menaquinone biosynthesis C-methylase UbiE